MQADIALNEQRITLVRGNLQASRDILAEKLVQDYKYGDTDTLAAILSSGSIGGMLDAADLLERSQTQVVELLQNLRADQGELAKREEALKKSVARAAELEAQTQAEKERIDAALAQTRELEAGLEDEIDAARAGGAASASAASPRRPARLLEVQRRLHGAGRPGEPRAGDRRRRARRSAAPLAARAAARPAARRAGARPRTSRPRRPPTARSAPARSRSRCSTSACRTSGAAPRRAASTAPAS